MPHFCVNIDGKSYEFKGDSSDWQAKPPDFIKDVILESGCKPEPHIMGVMVAMTEAITRNQSTSIDVQTWADGWSMTVKEMGK